MADWNLKVRLPGDLASEIEKRNRRADAEARRRWAHQLAGMKRRAEAKRWRPVRRFFDPTGIDPMWAMLMAHEPGRIYQPYDFQRCGVGNGWSPNYVVKSMMLAKATLGCVEQVGPNPAPSWDVIMWRLTADGETLRDLLIERCRQGRALPPWSQTWRAWRWGGLVAVLAAEEDGPMAKSRQRAAERFRERQGIVLRRPRVLLAGDLARGVADDYELPPRTGWLAIPVPHGIF